MPVIKLTQKIIPTLTCPPGRSRQEFCDGGGDPAAVRGLYGEARATSPGVLTWYLRYKEVSGKTKHQRLGTTQTMTLAEARKAALELKADIQRGLDPRRQKQDAKAVPTLSEFASEYLAYVKQRNRSWRTDEKRLNHRLLPRFGHHKLDAISRKEVTGWLVELKEEGLAGATVDHMAKLLRRILNVAIEWEVMAGPNPLAGIRLLAEDNCQTRFMNQAEMERLLTVLHTHPNRLPCLVALFLLSTGARLNEALTCRLEDIDFEARLWRLEAKSNKSKRVRGIPLNDSALEVLEEAADGRTEGWVFLNPGTGTHLATMHTAWKVIRKEAKLRG